MSTESDDLRVLADILELPLVALRAAMGSPWDVVGDERRAIDAVEGPLLIGLPGPSVAIRPIRSLAGRGSGHGRVDLTVGMASGIWTSPGSLEWEVGEPRVEMSHAEGDDSARLLSALARAVEAAAAAKRPSLITCRFCGAVVAPEHALDEDCCHACGTQHLGIVY